MYDYNLYLRARNCDEQFVIAALKECHLDVSQSSDHDDWKHIDLIVSNNNKCHYNVKDLLGKNIDVKRNSKQNRNSNNFSLTIVNTTGQKYPLDNDSYFAFIDDVNKNIYIIHYHKIQDFINHTTIYNGRQKKSKYILISKYFLKNHSDIILNPSNDVKNMLNN
jgi:hypothetical protein